MNQDKKIYAIYEQQICEKKKVLFTSLDYAATLIVLELKAAAIAAEMDAEGMKVMSEDKGVKIWVRNRGIMKDVDITHGYFYHV